MEAAGCCEVSHGVDFGGLAWTYGHQGMHDAKLRVSVQSASCEFRHAGVGLITKKTKHACSRGARMRHRKLEREPLTTEGGS